MKLEQISEDCDHSGLFPSPGGTKIVATAQHLFIAHGHREGGSVIKRFDGRRWTNSARLPIGPPYIACDRSGILHVAGLHRQKRDQVWYFRSAEPESIESFGPGEYVHPKNYSTMANDDEDNSLYYFGAGLGAEGLAFRRRKPDGKWTERRILGRGQLIYPGVAIKRGVIHLMFTGWDPPAAVYENVFYMRSQDKGVTWQKHNGEPIPIPFEYHPAHPEKLATLDRVSRTLAEGHLETSTHNQQIYVDDAGRPHVLYSFVPAYFPKFERTARLCLVHATVGKRGWEHRLLTSNPDIDAGGGAMVQDSEGVLHCISGVRKKGWRFFDLGHCVSRGGDWSDSRAVTQDADAHSASYTYAHWAAQPFRGELVFVVNRSGGGPLFLGRLHRRSQGAGGTDALPVERRE